MTTITKPARGLPIPEVGSDAALALVTVGEDDILGCVRVTGGSNQGLYIAITAGTGLTNWRSLSGLPVGGSGSAGFELMGSTDCSTNPNYPAADAGDAYKVSVAGKIGGASGTVVEVGDVYIASATNAGGTEAAVGTSWFTLQANSVASSETVAGLIEIATQAETDTGTDDARAVTPLKLANGQFVKNTGAGADLAIAFFSGATGKLIRYLLPFVGIDAAARGTLFLHTSDSAKASVLGLGRTGSVTSLFGEASAGDDLGIGAAANDAAVVTAGNFWLKAAAAILAKFTATTVQFAKQFLPPSDAGAFQTAAGLSAGSTAPNNANGANGDHYLRSNGMRGVRLSDAWVEYAGNLLRAPQVLTSGTSYTPPSGCHYVEALVVGGGGGGGGAATAAVSGSVGGGGGSGSWARKRYAVSGATFTYAIGAAGAAGADTGAAGGAGGDTTFTDGTTVITGKGGSGGAGGGAAGTAVLFNAGGAGGTVGTNGDANAVGHPGVYASLATGLVGASGSGAGGAFGGGGLGKVAAGAGNAGGAYGGGGGGGAVLNGSAAVAGGAGAAGVVVIYEFG